MGNTTYIHGTDRSEQARLATLNGMTNKAFIDFLEFEETNFMLEVGSGLGILTQEVAKRLPKGEAFGIEYSTEQLALAKSPLTHLHFVQGDAHTLPFEDERFDVVYCRYVLEHVANPLQVLKEMRRVLKPYGKAFVQENNILINMFDPECPHFDAVWRQFAALQERLGGDALIGKKLFSLFKKAGFQKIDLSFQPEIHYSGKPTFRPWVENLIGNIRSGEEELQKHRLTTKGDIGKAIAELRALMERDDASALFYWNRASGVK